MSDDAVRDEIWVGFPMADPPTRTRCRVASVVTPEGGGVDADQDVAVLELADPIPVGVVPARLRCPTPKALVGTKWWAFGFPPDHRRGSASDGEIGAALAQGWVRIDVKSPYHIEPGFSGTGLWSPDFEAVVGIVAEHDQQNGQAITIYQAAECLPTHGIRELAEESSAADSGELALAAWGWSLTTDPEGRRHWRPRARGVSIDSERGYRFRGRTAALLAIKAWLDRESIDRRALVVTGDPGAGKSAVLGRIVTTADTDAVRDLPRSDTAVRATAGSVACAVHAKGRTALEVAAQIAKAASAALPERLEDFAPALRTALAERTRRRFNVVIDALDESATPTEARLIVTKVVLPLAETCADVGAQAIVGSRRSDADGDLLLAFGGAPRLVDLDKREFFTEQDLAAYAHATLQLAGDERAGNPYVDDEIAAAVAERIASLSNGNFLVAGLTARTRGLYDEFPVDPATLKFSPKVDDAMREYLKRIPDVTGVSGASVSAETLLTALAFAESPGLPVPLWRVALKALGFADVDEPTLKRFARSSAASFLVESTAEHGLGTEFRLFHQALNDALLHSRATIATPREDERSLSGAFLSEGQVIGWDHAPAYLLRSLPGHADRAGLVDDLLADDDYLLYADLGRLRVLRSRAASEVGRQRETLISLCGGHAISADAPSRAAAFSVTEVLEGLPGTYQRRGMSIPYRATWAAAPTSERYSVSRGHDGEVNAVCTFTLSSTAHIATASNDATIRTWDPVTGTQLRTITGHHRRVNAVCALTHNGTTHLATASNDATIRTWDPATGTQLRTITGHADWVNAVCTLTLDGTTHLATASYDRTVRIWDPVSGTQLATLTGHGDEVNSVCPFTQDGTTYLATASKDATVRIWDPSTGTTRATLTGHDAGVNDVCAVTTESTTLLATASADSTVRIWDPATGSQLATLTGHRDEVNSVCLFARGGTTYLASTGNDRTVRIWDLATSGQLTAFTGHNGPVNAICTLTIDGTTHLATASNDATARTWNPSTGSQLAVLTGHSGPVNAICTLTVDGSTRLATGSNDRTVRIWNPSTGTTHAILTGHHGWVRGVCAFTLHGITQLATASYDRTVSVWDPATGSRLATLTGHTDWVNAICAFTLRGSIQLATAGDDCTARIWNPVSGAILRTLAGHKDRVNTICPFSLRGTLYLATASRDGTVRIWNPMTGTTVLVIPIRDEGLSVAYAQGMLAVGTATGLLAIRLDPEFLSRPLR